MDAFFCKKAKYSFVFLGKNNKNMYTCNNWKFLCEYDINIK